MTTNNRINAAELDFDRIKQNFKEYLKSQSKYQDYDFEGSNISILLDILAYNTHYNNLYTNFSLNEVFIDSALKRDSVVSIAKGLGYTPRSAVASKAVVDVVVTDVSSSAPPVLILERGSTFSSNVGNEVFTFSTLKPYQSQLLNTGYIFEDVEIVEGELLINKFLVEEGIRFIIPNAGCDTTTLKVKVQQNASNSNFDAYSSVESVVDTSFDALVYYIKEIENGLYEVFFGENIIGKQPADGNVVTLEYISTNGEVTNGAKVFSYSGDSLANGIVSTSIKELATSGKFQESIESIKVNAPNTFSSQNRAVTATDYKTLIYNLLPEVDSISVWGGQDNIPVTFGKVFVSIKPTGRRTISEKEKASVLSLLGGKMLVAILIEFRDPEELDIIIDSNVYYQPSKTNMSSEEIKLIVLEEIGKYNIENLNKFDGVYKHSVLSTRIDSSEQSIVSNISTIKLLKSFEPNINNPIKNTIYINNPIRSLESTTFNIVGSNETVYMLSDSDGIIKIVYRDSTLIEPVSLGNFGSIDRESGVIFLEGFTVSAAPENNIDITIIPESYDVVSRLNKIVSIDVSKVNVNMIIDDDQNYIFKPNRN